VHFGSIDATAGTAVTISENSDMLLDGLNGASVSLTAIGSITDSASAVIAVAGQGVLQAGGSITLGDTATDSVHFGSIDATAGTAIVLSEDSDMVVDGLNGASAALSTSGNITDSASAVIAVAGQGVLQAGGAITLGETATDSVHFGSIAAMAGTTFALSEDSDMVVDGLTAASAALSTSGNITDSGSAVIAVAGQGVLDAGDSITLGDTGTDSVNFGSLAATAGTAVTISEDSDMVVDGLSGASAGLTATGSITDSASAAIAVTNQGVLHAGGSITLGDTVTDSVDFGRINATAVSAIAINEDSGMVVAGLSAATASLTAAGSITDRASATIAVSGQGVLDAGGSITLGDTATDSVNFGSLDATAGAAVTISEDSDMLVDGLNGASASLTATGLITDSASAVIAVAGQGVLHAGDSITLGDTGTDSVHFGSIAATAGTAVVLSEDSDMVVDGLTAATAALRTSGNISDSASAVIAVAGQGVLQAGGSITLGDTGADSVDFGSIDAIAGAAVALSEDSAMVVDGLIAASAVLNSSGNITDSVNAIIAITGQGDLAAGDSITLGDTGTDSVNFGSLAAAAGSTIAITEDSDMALSAISGTSVSLASTGSMDDADAAAEATANVTGNQITLHAAGSIGAAGAGGDIDISAAALTVEFGGSVYVHNAADFSSLRLISTSVAASSYEIAGNNLAFAGLADGAHYQLADVSLTSGPGFDFSFRGDAGIAVGSVNAGNGNVTLTSMAGSILDAADDAATDITAAMATLAAAGGIGGTGIDTALETAIVELEARVTGAGDIHIVEADDLTLQTVAAAAGDFLITSGGSLSDSAGAIIDVAGQSVLHAGGSITLGDTGTDSVNFDSIAAAAGTAVAISENSDMVVDGLNAASVSLTSSGAITDSAGAIIAVTGQGVLHAGGMITLGDTGTDSVNFGSIDVTAGAAAAISEDSDMMIDGFNAAGVALHSGGNISDSAGAVIDVAGQSVLHAGGSITLGDTGTDSVNFGSIDAAAGTTVEISEDSAMVVDGLTAASAALRASGNISDSADAVLSVAGQGVLDAGGSITLGDTGTDSVNFGSLNAMAGTAAAISEDSDMLVDGLTAASAALRASGNISDSADALIAIADQGVLDAGGLITLGDTGTDSVNFGSIDAMAGTLVTLSEDSDMVIDGLTAAGAALNASGNITDSAGAIIAVAGQGVLDAGGSITLGDTGTDSVHFGSLDITAGTAVALSEDSAMVVDGLTAASAALRASGNISDSANAVIAVSGQGVLDAGGSITLGDTGTDSVHFGSLNATAGTAVAISEDSGMVIDGLHAASAALNANGNISDSANAVIAVAGQGVLHAGSAITLGDTATDSVNFGSLNATAGTAAAISEDSGMLVDGLHAASAVLNASGNISDSAGAIIAVSGQGVLNAGSAITLGDTATDSVNFGSLNATAGTAAAISEDSGMVIDGLHAAGAVLNASGNISDSAGAIIAVSGQGVLHAGSAISLGDTGTDSVNFGSIDATAGTTAAISEDSDMVVVRLNAASAMLTATRTLSAGRVNADHITFSAEEMNFTGGPGSIVGHDIFLQPVRQDQHISVAGTGDAGSGSLDLTTTDLGALADGFSTITIGRVNGTGRIYIPYNQFGWKDPVTFNAPDGGILTADVSDSVTESYADDPDSYNIFTGTGDASFTFMADSPTTFWLNGNIKTAGGDVFIDPDITTILRPGQINPAVKITDSVIAMDTDGGDITFGSMLGHTTYLMLLAGITETLVDGGTINGAIEVYGLRLSGSGGELGVIITSVDNAYSQDKWPAVYTIVTLPAPHYGSFTFNDLPVRGLSIDRDPQNAFLLGLVTFFGFSSDLFSIESYALPEGYSDEEEGEEGEDEASDTTPSEAGFGLTGSEGDSQ
jgi:predicted nucleotidyltransferase